jgi:hypothetical protein
MDSPLYDQINYDKAYRHNRYGAAQWVMNHPESMPELLEYCFKHKFKISYKANWSLEFVCIEKLELLYPYFNLFFKNLPEVYQHQSVRALSHICEIICIQFYKHNNPAVREVFLQPHKEKLVECCFDWLITEQKIACQARAMLCLYYLGTEFNWIYPELKQILENNMPSGSPGYKSRAKKILAKIKV